MSRKTQPVPLALQLFGCVFFLFGSTAYASDYQLLLPNNDRPHVELEFENRPTNSHPEKLFKLFTGPASNCCEGRTAMAGRYDTHETKLTFTPAFAFEKAQIYTISINYPNSQGEVIQELTEFFIPDVEAFSAPKVIGIYPSGSAIPENTLRFYIYFSTPMQPHVSSRHIKLVDAAGQVDDAAFMSFKQELWSEDRKRLTLLMDPGRIKRGVAQNLSMGPALAQSYTYTILINDGWPSARGEPLTGGFGKTFTASQALRTLPDTKTWETRVPGQNTNNPLVFVFDRPFDYELLKSAITVLDENGQPVNGDISIRDDEHTWIFTPEYRWHQERITVRVDSHLEDVAGNNFRDLLDHAMGTQLNSSEAIVLELSLTDE